MSNLIDRTSAPIAPAPETELERSNRNLLLLAEEHERQVQFETIKLDMMIVYTTRACGSVCCSLGLAASMPVFQAMGFCLVTNQEFGTIVKDGVPLSLNSAALGMLGVPFSSCVRMRLDPDSVPRQHYLFSGTDLRTHAEQAEIIRAFVANRS